MNSGTTEPLEPSTLPKRTDTYCVPANSAATACTTCSARRLVAPITLVGFTALSVDTSTKRAAPTSPATRAACSVPSTLVRSASISLCASISGTCL